MDGYLIVGLAVSEDEIDGAFNVAILEVMLPLLVVQGVLGAVESHAVKLGLVSVDSECHRLLSNSSTGWCRGKILVTQRRPQTHKNSQP